MTRCLQFLWRWGWLPSVCLLVWFVPWCLAVYQHFQTFGIVREIAPFEVQLGELAHSTLQADWLRLRSRFISIPPEVRDVRELDLRCDALHELDRELPWSGREAVLGALLVAGKPVPVRIRYRGDTYVHWGRAKKSFRVRMLDDTRIDGMRDFNLCVAKYPEQLNNDLTYHLADLLGLMAPRCEPVKLWLNGEYHGAFWLIEQPSAALIERAGRAPDTLFEGELLCRDAWTGVSNNLFVVPGMWERTRYTATAKQHPEQPDAALGALLRHLQAPASEESVVALSTLLDLEQFARFSVLEQISQTHHFDHFHNWRLHWDRAAKRFEPLVWDPVGWQETMRAPRDESIDLHPAFTLLHAHLQASAKFLAMRDRVLRQFFALNRDQQLLEYLEKAISTNAALTACDPNLWPPNPDLVDKERQLFEAAVRRNLKELRSQCLDAPMDVSWSTVGGGHRLLVKLNSPRVAQGLRIVLRAPPALTAASVGLMRADGVRVIHDLSPHWRVNGNELELRVALPSALHATFSWQEANGPIRNHHLRATVTTYEFTLTGLDLTSIESVHAGDPGHVGGNPRARSMRDDELLLLPTRSLFGLAATRY